KKSLRWYIRWKSELGELHAESYLLRSQRSEKMTRGAIWYRWKKHCVGGHTVHHARHSFGTLLLEASGGNLRVVQKALGHSRITTTTVYADAIDQTVRDSMRAMDQLARRSMQPKRNPTPGRMNITELADPVDDRDLAQEVGA